MKIESFEYRGIRFEPIRAFIKCNKKTTSVGRAKIAQGLIPCDVVQINYQGNLKVTFPKFKAGIFSCLSPMSNLVSLGDTIDIFHRFSSVRVSWNPKTGNIIIYDSSLDLERVKKALDELFNFIKLALAESLES